MKLLLVAGARPNFMKIAPIIRALSAWRNRLRPFDRLKATASQVAQSVKDIEWKIVHTGQHYDYEMSRVFFDELEIPEPDYYLGAGSGSHAEQTAKVMVEFEKVCVEEKPDVAIVVGDVNSTLACSVTAKKLNIHVAHVEAGLRSGDMTMPEEINRIVTDSIADYLFVTEKSGEDNLLKEGKSKGNIHFVGHVMIDNLLYQLQKLKQEDSSRFESNALKEKLGKYAFLTLHRPSNVDDKEVLSAIAGALNEMSQETPIVFPIHPRTRKMIDEFGTKLSEHIHILEPLSFRESLFLWRDALFVMTDSGGLQEETTALGVPCITIRENTERPITIEIGTNILAGNKKADILKCYTEIMKNPKKGEVPPLWDGKAAERIVDILMKESKTAQGNFG
jgi:UDP-N-acetylglucosamine 2-epimerase (non-hydrolysing)